MHILIVFYWSSSPRAYKTSVSLPLKKMLFWFDFPWPCLSLYFRGFLILKHWLKPDRYASTFKLRFLYYKVNCTCSLSSYIRKYSTVNVFRGLLVYPLRRPVMQSHLLVCRDTPRVCFAGFRFVLELGSRCKRHINNPMVCYFLFGVFLCQ